MIKVDLGLVGGAGGLAGVCIHERVNRIWIDEFVSGHERFPKDHEFPSIFHAQWSFRNIDEKGPQNKTLIQKEVKDILSIMPFCNRWMLCCISAQSQGFSAWGPQDQDMENRRIKMEKYLESAIRHSGWVLSSQVLNQELMHQKKGKTEAAMEMQKTINELIEALYQGRMKNSQKEQLKNDLLRGAMEMEKNKKDDLRSKIIAVACTELDLLEDLWREMESMGWTVHRVMNMAIQDWAKNHVKSKGKIK